MEPLNRVQEAPGRVKCRPPGHCAVCCLPITEAMFYGHRHGDGAILCKLCDFNQSEAVCREPL